MVRKLVCLCKQSTEPINFFVAVLDSLVVCKVVHFGQIGSASDVTMLPYLAIPNNNLVSGHHNQSFCNTFKFTGTDL
jgi:hypothetical protein